MQESLSYFKAAIEEGTGCDSSEEVAWKLFQETQHLQPDREAINRYINDKFQKDVTSTIKQIKRKKGDVDHYVYIAGRKHIEKEKYPDLIKALGYQLNCNSQAKKVQLSSPAAQVIKHEIKWPSCEFKMDNVLSMDIETGSIMGTGGRFEPYVIEWICQGKRDMAIATTAEDLKEHSVIHHAIQAWLKIADSLGEEKVKHKTKTITRPRTLYIYAHNMSKFDGLFVIRSILQHKGDIIDDLETAPNKYVSFRYKNLVFRDSLQLTNSSLKAAALAYGCEASKGYLPHRYLQNCASREQLLERIHNRVPYKDLEPYMDWFADTDDGEMHKREHGRTYEEWIASTQIYKDWFKKKDDECDFKTEMLEYLAKDVACLHQLVEKLGTMYAAKYGANIEQKFTIGSLVVHIHQYTIFDDIPKLAYESQNQRWQRTNTGGFSGPLSKFVTVASEGENIYKVDLTSCYPSVMTEIEYVTATGLKRPLERYYRGFPNANAGWKTHDFEGVEMTREICDSLEHWHGLVKITFDQRSLPFPAFLMRLKTSTSSTLTPVMQGTEYYIIPQIRMAFDKGAKIWLHDCEYTAVSHEPFQNYINHFKNIKNTADEEKDKYKELYKKSGDPDHLDCVRKADHQRTMAKLCLNSLYGRYNMRTDRTQAFTTKSANDCIGCISDSLLYRNVNVDASVIDDDTVFKVSYKEGSYEQNIENFKVAPYLTGYILGYAKMLMFQSFDWLARRDVQLLYTDTDSICFKTTPAIFEDYKKEFVPIKKTFGAMDLEGTFKELVTFAPKKYACAKANGDYTWQAAGLPAKSNARHDIRQMFLDVLSGETVQHAYGAWETHNFTPHHPSPGTTKDMQMMSLKGRIEDGGLKWWESDEEFQAYASTLFTGSRKRPRDETEECCTDKKQKLDTHYVSHYVYILNELNGIGTYVGESKDYVRRLAQHNAGTGGECTVGRQWELLHVLEGCVNKKNAVSLIAKLKTTCKNLETALQNERVAHHSKWIAIIEKSLSYKAWKDIKLIYSKPSESSSD